MQIYEGQVGFTGFEAAWVESQGMNAIIPSLLPLARRIRDIRLRQSAETLKSSRLGVQLTTAAIQYARSHEGAFQYRTYDAVFAMQWQAHYVTALRTAGSAAVMVRTEANPLELRRLGIATNKTFRSLSQRLMSAGMMPDHIDEIVSNGPLVWLDALDSRSSPHDTVAAMTQAAVLESSVCELHAVGGMTLAIGQHLSPSVQTQLFST